MKKVKEYTVDELSNELQIKLKQELLTENDISATDEDFENETGENPEKSFAEEDYTPLFSSNNDTNETEEKEESEK